MMTMANALKAFGLLGLVLSISGLIVQYYILTSFNLSLTDFADLDDFIIASIALLNKEYLKVAGGMIVLSILLSTWMYISFKRSSGTPVKLRKLFYPTSKSLFIESTFFWFEQDDIKATKINLLMFAFMLFVFSPLLIGHWQVLDIKEGEFCPVEVQLRHPVNANIKSETNSKLFLISALNSSAFFWEAKENNVDNVVRLNEVAVHVVPSGNIASMRFSCEI